jgi:hypothetical protein
MTPWLRPKFLLIPTIFVLLGLILVAPPSVSSEDNAPELVNGVEEDESEDVSGSNLLRPGKKRIGRFRRKEDLTSILFPGASPVREVY